MQTPATAPARPVPIDATQQLLRGIEQRMSQWPGPAEQGHGRCVVLAENEQPLDCDSTALAAVLQLHTGLLSELQQMLRTMQGETTLTIAFSDGRYQVLIAR